MAHVNLLPWRAERRKLREREFFGQLILSFVAGLCFILLWTFWMGMRIDNQNDRNTILQGEIKQLDVKIAQIKDLEKVREHLLARKQIIEQLQADRSKMVHLFDELVKTIPSSVRLTALKQTGDTMSLDGVAQSNASVAEYMRNIEASQWMGHVDLRKTENIHDTSGMPYSFGINVKLSKPKADESGATDDLAPAGSAATVPVAAPVAPPAPLASPAHAGTAHADAARPSAAAKGGAKA